jgi:hypothetical protein
VFAFYLYSVVTEHFSLVTEHSSLVSYLLVGGLAGVRAQYQCLDIRLLLFEKDHEQAEIKM